MKSEKPCITCQRKEAPKFHNSKRLGFVCSYCFKKDYRERNKEKVRESRKRNYRENKEKVLTKSALWRENNKDRLEKYFKEYYELNKKERKQKRKKYYEENKETIKSKWREKYKQNREYFLEKSRKAKAKARITGAQIQETMTDHNHEVREKIQLSDWFDNIKREKDI